MILRKSIYINNILIRENSHVIYFRYNGIIVSVSVIIDRIYSPQTNDSGEDHFITNGKTLHLPSD
jgi:hypothetical protein